MWEWYEWNSLEAFEQWHTALKQKLGYPLIGYNQATGEPQPESAWVTQYTEPIAVDGKWIAVVEPKNAVGLTKTDLRWKSNWLV